MDENENSYRATTNLRAAGAGDAQWIGFLLGSYGLLESPFLCWGGVKKCMLRLYLLGIFRAWIGHYAALLP